MRTNREMIEAVASALGDLLERVVFVGGSVVELYGTDPAAPPVRPTIDVDCIIDVSTKASFYELENILRLKGFTNDQSYGAPICRWLYDGITVDVMPTTGDILGFTNKWYAIGLEHAVPVELTNDLTISILNAPYYLAVKLSALEGRGMNDLRLSRDFEDIVYIVRNRSGLEEEIKSIEETVMNYISGMMGKLLSDGSIEEAISAVMDYGEPSNSIHLVRERMRRLSSLLVKW